MCLSTGKTEMYCSLLFHFVCSGASLHSSSTKNGRPQRFPKPRLTRPEPDVPAPKTHHCPRRKDCRWSPGKIILLPLSSAFTHSDDCILDGVSPLLPLKPGSAPSCSANVVSWSIRYNLDPSSIHRRRITNRIAKYNSLLLRMISREVWVNPGPA